MSDGGGNFKAQKESAWKREGFSNRDWQENKYFWIFIFAPL